MMPQRRETLEGSVQTEQELLNELQALRSRVAELEEIAEAQRQKLISEQQLRLEVEATLRCIQTSAAASRQQVEQLQKRLADRPAAQTRDLETIFEALTDALCVYDRSGTIIRVNQAFRVLMGLDLSPTYSMLSMNERGACIQVADENGKPLSPELWPVNRILRGDVLEAKNSPDITISALDGRVLQISACGAPLHDEVGAIIGAVTIYRDVTERRRLERRSQEALEALLAMAEVLVKGVDHHAAEGVESHAPLNRIMRRLATLAQRVLDCQRVGVVLVEASTGELHLMALAGAASDERKRWSSLLEGTCLSDHIHDARVLGDLSAGKLLRSHSRMQGLALGASAGYFLLPMRIGTQLIGLLFLDYGGRIQHLTEAEVAIAKAVSRLMALVLEREHLLQERAEAHANELALLEANRRTDEFLSIASHELRTPLTTINGNIQLAKRRMRTLTRDDPQEEFDSRLALVMELLGRAERQVYVQNRLVSDLLDVSRIQANRLELRSDVCNLVAIVSECVEDQRAAHPTRVLSLTLPAHAIPILADPDRISQVVTNYLTNALKYSAATMPVEVSLSEADGFARIAVRDQGPGLLPEEHQQVWQRFYRVPGIGVRSGSGVGLGLGLYICRTIVERHHGQVGVQSTQGQGSVFWFTLPIMTNP
jgi:signal transduction histidine kinase/PAS domain-containing protein